MMVKKYALIGFLIVILLAPAMQALAGYAWVELGGSASGGGISSNSGHSWHPSLALDGNGYPVVAWTDSSGGDHEIYIKRWNGSAWVEVGAGSASGGGISNNSEDSYHPSLALDGDGYPVVAWYDYTDPGDEIYVKLWNGSAWVEVGIGSVSDGFNPSLALDENGYPVVAWQRAGEIYLKRWDGSAWVELGGSASGGGISNNGGESSISSLALDGNGYPVIAWHDYSSGNFEIYVRRWNGSGWVEVGTGSASGGGISNNSGSSSGPSLALDGNGYPVIAWMDNSGGDFEIYVRRWNGSAWVEVGTGSASGGGISNNSGWSEYPSLALDGNGYPVTAWDDGSGVDWEIYVKRWNGSAWVEVGTGSASGGGISNNGGESKDPSLALDGNGYPIMAWFDYSSGDPEIYLKRVVDDTSPPTGSISINNDAACTAQISVTLQLTATDDLAGVAEMQISNDPAFSGASWEAYATFKSWQLEGGEGVKTVYVRYKDRVGNVSTVYSDTIQYISHCNDQGNFDYVPPTGSIIINSDALGTASTGVFLQLSASDDQSGVPWMEISNTPFLTTSLTTNSDSWESFSSTKVWTLEGADGLKTVYIRYKDGANNVSLVYSDTIDLDTSVGDEYGLTINDGALFTNKVTVTLSLPAKSYTVQMMVSNDGGFAGASWEPYATHKEWQITQYGEYIIPRVVYAKYKDLGGNLSSVYQDDIILDVTAPTGSMSITPGVSGAVAAADDASVGALVVDPNLYPYQLHLPLIMKGLYTPPDLPPNATLHLTAQDDLSGVAEMSFSDDGLGWTLWEAYATTRAWHVAEQGTSTVYAKFRDSAGNISEACAASITF